MDPFDHSPSNKRLPIADAGLALAAASLPGVLALAACASGAGTWAATGALLAGAAASTALLVRHQRGRGAPARELLDWALERSRGHSAALDRSDLGDLAEHADALESLICEGRAFEAMRSEVRDQLREAPARVASALEEIGRGRNATEEAVEETASLLANINNSIKRINEEVESLSRATEEASSSILEMGSAIDEVARSAGSLHDSVDASTSSIHEISASIRQVADSADAVQSMAEESAAAMVQMDRAIQEVGQHVAEASELTEQVSSGAEEGSRAVLSTIEGIEEIRNQTRTSREVLERLVQRINEIGEIVNVIGGINDETNLLSLNAAIIAAQAGEQGKAFAVVANHVKTLAQRTAGSTKEIESLIAAVQEESSNAVAAMGVGMQAVETGVTRSRQAGDQLGSIRDLARDASSRVSEIARATGEQTRNSKHVAEAAQRTSSMVQQITTGVTEQSRASEAMLKNAESALELCRQVHRSTEEQRESGRFITASISSVTDMIRSIQRNTEAHGAASEAVAEAVSRILEIAVHSSEHIPDVIDQLQLLRTEAGRLLGESDSAEPLTNASARV